MNKVSPSQGESSISTTKLVWSGKTGAYAQLQPDDPGPIAWKFIPGPIQLINLAKVYPLGKRAVAVYLLLHTAIRMDRGRHKGWSVIPARELKRFHIDDASKGRVVAAIEKLGLIKVKRDGRRSLLLRLGA